MMVPFSRRLDPEKQKPLEWIWRKLIAAGRMQRFHWSGEASPYGAYAPYEDQAGYCLDRWSHIDFPPRNK